MFRKLFGLNKPSISAKASADKKEDKKLPWIPLNAIEQLQVIAEQSVSKTQLIFKHSTRCGISKMVINQFIAKYDLELNADLYYLDLLSYREVSIETGFKFQVLHESPQLLVVKNGVVVAHASHGAVNDLDLSQLV